MAIPLRCGFSNSPITRSEGQMNLISKLVAGAVLSGALWSQAIAAPFCAVFAYGQQCYYYDVPSCERAAAAGGGGCVVNQQPEMAQPPVQPLGAGPPFCVVSAVGTQCYYYTAPACERAAAMSGGACVVRQ